MIKALVINFLWSTICAWFFWRRTGGWLYEWECVYLCKSECICKLKIWLHFFFFLRNLLLMRNGDFKELGVWSCQIKEPKRYNYMVLYLISMPLSLSLFLKYLSIIISFNLCFSILKFCSSSYEKINNKSPSFQVNMKGLDWIPGAKSFYNYDAPKAKKPTTRTSNYLQRWCCCCQ